jgi:hypothetical protein
MDLERKSYLQTPFTKELIPRFKWNLDYRSEPI